MAQDNSSSSVAQRHQKVGHASWVEVSITSYLQPEEGLIEVDEYSIDSLKPHCDQFGNSGGLIDASSHLKLRNAFSTTLLEYAESHTLWRDIPKLLNTNSYLTSGPPLTHVIFPS